MHTVDAVRVSYGGQSASYGVQCSVFEVKRTQEFDEWLKALPDRDGAARIDARLARLALGSFGDHKSIRKGLSEVKIDVGPGYRVYYARRGETLYLLLCGGDKSTQKKDITRALGMLGKLKEEASDGKGKSKGKSKGKRSKGKS